MNYSWFFVRVDKLDRNFFVSIVKANENWFQVVDKKTCFQQNCIHFQEKLKKLNEFKLNNFKILLFKIQKCIFKSQNFGLELRNQTKSCHISMKQKTISRRCQFFSLFYRTFCEFSKTFSQFFAFIPLEVPCRDFNTCSRLKIA